MKHRGLKGVLPFIIIFAILSCGFILLHGWMQRRDNVIISHDSGIYTEGFQLEVRAWKSPEIYYTTDGTSPDPAENPAAIPYSGPITISSEETSAGTAVYSLQLFCRYEDGRSSRYQREYLIDPNGTSRFTTDYVISITGSETELFDYDRGIMVRGRQFDEYMEAYPDTDLDCVVIPANYLDRREVPVHISVFTSAGQELVSKQIGMRISGNVTRAKNQKSLRLTARTEYDGRNEFEEIFLPKLYSETKNTTVDAYQRLTLHSSGNDNGYGFVRSTLVGELARQSGFPDVLVSQSATVYVNGRYQGVYWLQNTFDDKYFQEKYDAYGGEMIVAEGALSYLNPANAENNEETWVANEYNALCDWAMSVNLQPEENWQRISDSFDLQNLARYLAIEYFVGNKDWPQNNVKVYRYLSMEEDYQPNTVFDGKYRYLLFDTDYGFGLIFHGFGLYVNSPKLASMLEGNDSAQLFAALMQKAEFRNLFVNSVLHLMEGSFSAGNVEQTLAELTASTDAELEFMYEKTDLMKNSLWEPDDNGMPQIRQSREVILDFAGKRPAFVLEEMQSLLNTGSPRSLVLETLDVGSWRIDGLDAGADYDGYCMEQIPMQITCKLPTGFSVSGYYVNDDYYPGETLSLCAAQLPGLESGEGIMIAPLIDTFEQEELSVFSYETSGDEDRIVLINSGNTPLQLSDYSISDSMDLSKGRLPSLILQPGEKFTVFGKNYTGEIPPSSIKVTFAWNNEETITLAHIHSGIIEQKIRRK